nr:hypothetical protein [uncultured Desulfobacter sp.]
MKKIKKINIDLPQDYHLEELDCGLNLHVITAHNLNPFVCTFALVSSFGSSFENKIYPFPFGTAHFLEHFNFFANREIARELSYKFGCDLNGIVNENSTIVKGNFLIKSENPTPDLFSHIVLSIVQYCINFSLLDFEIKKLIEHTIRDVANEISYRHDKIDYILRLKLIQNFYHSESLNHDSLGDIESLSYIDNELIKLAHNEYCNRINSILIICNNQPKGLAKKINNDLNKIGFTLPQSNLRNIYQKSEPSSVKSLYKGFQCKKISKKVAPIVFGFKLKSFEKIFKNHDPAIVALFWTLLTINSHLPFAGELRNPGNPIIYSRYNHENPRFFWDKGLIFELEYQFRKLIMNSINRIKPHFDSWFVNGLLTLCESRDEILNCFLNICLLNGSYKNLVKNKFYISEELINIFIADIQNNNKNFSMAFASMFYNELD